MNVFICFCPGADPAMPHAGLPGRIESAVAAFRDSDAFYDSDRFLSMKEDVNAACQLISFQFDHIQFNKYSRFEEFPFNNFEEIRAALDHPDSMMLAGFYRDTIIPEIKAKQPEIVGISVPYFPQLIPGFLLAREIRKVSPNTHITQGGPVIGWGKDILWYTMEYCHPQHEAFQEKFQQIIAEIESLYPNLKRLDLSRERVYPARYGKLVLKKLNKNQYGRSVKVEYANG